LEISKGETDTARSLLVGLRSKNPTARYLLRWLDDYSQARKSLGTLNVLRVTASEELLKDQSSLGSDMEKSSEAVKKIFGAVETKILSGEAHTIKEAFRQLEGQADDEEKSLLTRLQSNHFAGGAISEIARASSLSGNLEGQALLAVAYEAHPQSVSPGLKYFRLMSGGPRIELAEAGQQELLPWPEKAILGRKWISLCKGPPTNSPIR
jgi:hypothetical protein